MFNVFIIIIIMIVIRHLNITLLPGFNGGGPGTGNTEKSGIHSFPVLSFR